jgi:hypothetical protein
MAHRGVRPHRAAATIVRSGHQAARFSRLALVVPARPRADFLFGILFAAISNSRPHRPPRTPSSTALLGRSRSRPWTGALLVCAVGAVVVIERPDALGALRGRHAGFTVARSEYFPSQHVGRLPDCLPFVHQRRPGFFQLPVGWDVARSGIHQPVFCAGRMASRVGRGGAAFSGQPVPAAVAVVPHLL